MSVSEVENKVIETLSRTSRETLFGTAAARYPKHLYHFTDAVGVIGVVQSKTLFASRAMSLNDASEVHHGIELAKEYLTDRIANESGYRKDFCSRVLALMDPARVPVRYRVTVDPFVVSFCATDQKSSHWLHYGRSGNGYALGFDPVRLQTGGADLVRVVYERAEQRATIDGAARRLEETLLEVIERDCAGSEKQAATAVAAHLFANGLWVLAARMKDPAFVHEDEWRLISLDVQGDGVDYSQGVPTEMRYRAVGNRVVPCVPIDYAKQEGGLPLSSITVGYGVDFAATEPSLRHLLRNSALSAETVIERSRVPLR